MPASTGRLRPIGRPGTGNPARPGPDARRCFRRLTAPRLKANLPPRCQLNPESATGRPASGFGHYLRDLVYGALDGVITTLAVIAGAAGAHLEPRVGIILGLANLVADGLSMGASNYLGLKSELEQANHSVAAEAPWRHGLATAAAFATVGAVPLAGYAVAPVLGVRCCRWPASWRPRRCWSPASCGRRSCASAPGSAPVRCC